MRQRLLHKNALTVRLTLVFAVALATCFASSALQAQGDGDESPSQKIISEIRKRGYKKVAVLPRDIVLKLDLDNKDNPSVITKNTLGPLANEFANDLYGDLKDAAAAGKDFTVIPKVKVLSAIANRNLKELDGSDIWEIIRKKTGADAVIQETVTDPGPEHGGKQGATELGKDTDLVDSSSGESVVSIPSTHSMTLSDAAYAGNSFVVHEWQGDKLRSTGLSKSPFLEMGLDAERKQFENLRPGPHPLNRKGHHYGISVLVNGKVRQPVNIDETLYVPLEIGEKYQLQIWNTGTKQVFAGVYVDGLNTIGQQPEHPSVTDTNRTWWLRPTGDRGAVIEGWFNHNLEDNQRALVNEFVVVGSEEALAKSYPPGEEIFGSPIGMITAIFYTYGTDEIQLTKSARVARESSIGTGKGAAIDSKVSEYEKEKKLKGLMLSSMTLYYRTPQQIAQIEADTNSQRTPTEVKMNPGKSILAVKPPEEAMMSRKDLQKRSIPLPKADPEETSSMQSESETKEPPKVDKQQQKQENDATTKKPKPGSLEPGNSDPCSSIE